MNLGIIAHNSKKVLIEDFCIAYKNILAKHEVYATGTTGRRIEEATSLHVHKFLAGSIGQAVHGDGRASGSGYGHSVLQSCYDRSERTGHHEHCKKMRSV